MRQALTLVFLLALSTFTNAQSDWPKTITASNGAIIKIYQMQPESFSGNQLKYRSAVSIQQNNTTDPVFGTFWALATVETDRDNRTLSILSVKIPNVKFASDSEADQLSYIKSLLEFQIPALSSNLQLDPITSSLEMRTEEKKVSKDLNNNPPKIIFSNHPAMLVLIDGEPKLQNNAEWGVDVVVNSPFTIVKSNNTFYLYGAKKWFSSGAATGPYQLTNNIPYNFSKIEAAISNANNADPGFTTDTKGQSADGIIPEIIVSTQPAELIQTKGEANFNPIDGTSLLYVTNSDNDIFMDTNSQKYYVLVSGRWYVAPQLNTNNWQYIAANTLPADFSKIPEGSKKDNVLASVAGTDAAREAVMDAQIPQTAKVDRKNASTDVTYDGNPQFENINGTSMQYAVNTQNSVIRYRDRYYTVDKGVWFEAPTATGPWSVCVKRPEEVDIIPPSYPVYNMKYVYIYDSNPDWVYTGYTPGYLNAYIYGPTVVYGTGFYYRPWYGHHFYPRPYTWGFGMQYNPWTGWGFGFDYSYGWFNMGFGFGLWGGWGGGWWGPSIYRPPYGYNPYARAGYGYYGRNVYNRNAFANNYNHSFRATNNVYNLRRDVVTVNNGRMNSVNNSGINRVNNTQRSQGGASVNSANGVLRNNITTDRAGNVYQRNQQGQWQQNQQHQWQPVNQNQQVQNLNRQQQMQQRGEVRSQNFQMQRSSAPAPRSSGNSGGGSRSSGGGGHRNR